MAKLSIFSGNLVVIGFGSIAKATLPLLLQQETLILRTITVIAPVLEQTSWFEANNIIFIQAHLDEDNYEALLDRYVDRGDFLLNLSVDVSSIALMTYAAHAGALYLDTCIEPWAGGYIDPALSSAQRTNYALRQQMLTLRNKLGKGPTAVVAHGANPGLISHLLKAGLMRLADELKHPAPLADGQVQWARLAMQMGVKVVHIAEHDTQRSTQPRQAGEFINTWSVDGFISEAGQPAELAWGTHERHWRKDARRHRTGAKNAIYLDHPSATVPVRTWTPVAGSCLGLLITHHETCSLADYLTLREHDEVIYRPTLHYAYRCCDDALLSINELIGNDWAPPRSKRVMGSEVADGGIDALGVLLMGHALNAYWFGSMLSVDQARVLVPFNTATSLQVAAGVFAGMVWAVRNPDRGIVEAEDMDHTPILDTAAPYLGRVVAQRTDWRPTHTSAQDKRDDIQYPWQFAQFAGA
ncbi:MULTISPECIES: saccharopine dehydrogenase C-terminal domain-containing protein [unclassified Pseudomonas]|uniref:saccharopine dehydrogenase C-terminal domain-containing protein n=1 Tax=unclassified Pseudomonas TaxID=196821 RepID=UPI000F5825CE|nr:MULTISPECIES: saccharopine dehydrogenase C-terminal domain-containing protein [unclassified Pseudomonas]AZF46823.1 Homospermidine synthase [Pseudomonas sp. R2-7-07]AZF57334.1 Homospermidine synthase [Pseudomonas sp. R11-23-07]